jgi:hypothetical protein
MSVHPVNEIGIDARSSKCAYVRQKPETLGNIWKMPQY